MLNDNLKKQGVEAFTEIVWSSVLFAHVVHAYRKRVLKVVHAYRGVFSRDVVWSAPIGATQCMQRHALRQTRHDVSIRQQVKTPEIVEAPAPPSNDNAKVAETVVWVVFGLLVAAVFGCG